MSKIPVSVCIIAKNEEKYIEECLKRLKPYGFEIIVTDTGSTDRTREIALQYADKVLDFPWRNDFSAARNFCVENAANNWILSLDCDEYVNSIDIGGMRRLMQQYPRKAGTIRLKNLTGTGENQGFEIQDIIRFYNRNYYTFMQPVHEQITHKEKGKERSPIDIFLLPMEVIHLGYALSGEEMAKKQERNLEILNQAIADNPQDPYLYFQVGQSENVLGNYGRAAEMFEKTLLLNDNAEYTYVEMAVRDLAAIYIVTGRMENALEIMEKYASSCHSAKFVYMHANVYFESGNTLKALVLYIKATILPDSDTLGNDLLQCYKRIIKIYNDMGNSEMVWAFREKYEQCAIERNRVLESQEEKWD